MTKSSIFLFALLISFTQPLTAEAAEKKTGGGNPATGLHELTFFFSNDVRGETEPCG